MFDLQDLSNGLGNAQVASGEEHHKAIVGFFVNDHFAKRTDLIQPCIGPGVG